MKKYRYFAPTIAAPLLLIFFLAEASTTGYDKVLVGSFAIIVRGCILYNVSAELVKYRADKTHLGDVTVVYTRLNLG